MTARLLLANLLELVVASAWRRSCARRSARHTLAGSPSSGSSRHTCARAVSFGWIGLALLAAAAVVVTWRTLPRRWMRPRFSAGASPGSPLVVFLVHAWPTFTSKPLDDYDGWAIWGMKGKALFLIGWADPSLFAAAAAEPAHRDYPLLVPSLEAVASRRWAHSIRSSSTCSSALRGCRIAALHGLLRDRVQPWLLWPFSSRSWRRRP